MVFAWEVDPHLDSGQWLENLSVCGWCLSEKTGIVGFPYPLSKPPLKHSTTNNIIKMEKKIYIFNFVKAELPIFLLTFFCLVGTLGDKALWIKSNILYYDD
jgi:hypothetical protein